MTAVLSAATFWTSVRELDCMIGAETRREAHGGSFAVAGPRRVHAVV
jgi:hypothetical protein